jgi:hypothetical protein
MRLSAYSIILELRRKGFCSSCTLARFDLPVTAVENDRHACL